MSAVPALPPGYRLVTLDEVDSTNEEAKRGAASGAAAGTVIWARSQRRGRGRRGREWISPPGNLYCSLLLRPEQPPDIVAQLGFAAALAAGQAIAALLPDPEAVRHKWPNDVLVRGRKVAGILLESSGTTGAPLEWLVIGTGVNVASHPDDPERPATSLAAEGAKATVSELLERYLACLDPWLGRWRGEGFEPLRKAWLAHAQGLGEAIEVRLPRGTLAGRFAGLDAAGALIVAEKDGTRRTVTAGEVFLPPAPGSEKRV